MNDTYQRKSYFEALTEHLRTPNPPIQVILGPRQVGKTTAILAYLEEWPGLSFYHTADRIAPPDAAWLEKCWGEARSRFAQQKKNRGLLVFDEVQKVPRWSEVVKKCFDEDRRKKLELCVVLLGSSSLLVQRGLSESLAGRFEIIPFPHWLYKECRDCFGISLSEYIFYGGYPGAIKILLDSNHDAERWSAYVRNALIETVLNKDILLLTPVTKPALFRQVFSISCVHASEILSLNKMLGQLQEAGNASTVASYLKLLDAAMLLKPLERYAGDRLRQKISSPKLIVLNNALINASLERRLKEVRKDGVLWGRLLENAVGASLVNNNTGKGVEVFYWRDRNQEVDFVLRFGEKVLAIEVKTNRERKSEGIRPFLRKYPAARGIVTALSGGDIPLEELINMTAGEIFTVLS